MRERQGKEDMRLGTGEKKKGKRWRWEELRRKGSHCESGKGIKERGKEKE